MAEEVVAVIILWNVGGIVVGGGLLQGDPVAPEPGPDAKQQTITSLLKWLHKSCLMHQCIKQLRCSNNTMPVNNA